MNLIATLSISLILPTCTVIIDTTPPKKSKAVVHGRTPHKTKHATPIPSSTPPNVKETWWVENYHKLEAAHGNYTIPDDANIKPLPDGRFKVPDKVLTHYQDLLLAKPSP